MDYSLPGSSVHGISQARILEGVTIPFSRGPKNGTCIAGRFLTAEPPGKPTSTLWGCEWPDPPENLLLSCRGRAACGWYRYNDLLSQLPAHHPPCFPPGPGPPRFTTTGTPASSPTAQGPEVTLSFISDPLFTQPPAWMPFLLLALLHPTQRSLTVHWSVHLFIHLSIVYYLSTHSLHLPICLPIYQSVSGSPSLIFCPSVCPGPSLHLPWPGSFSWGLLTRPLVFPSP